MPNDDAGPLVPPSEREQVVLGLELLGGPAEAATVGIAAEVITGVMLLPSQIAKVRRAERGAWTRAEDSAQEFVVPAIHFEDLRPISTALTVSNWDLELRVIGPLSGRVNYLRTASRVAAQLADARARNKQESPSLERLVWRFARGLPQLDHSKSIEPDQMAAAAAAELALCIEDDASDRADAAQRLRMTPLEVQLFGTPASQGP